MDEELDGNPHLEKFYEHMSKKLPGPNPHAFPLQEFFLFGRYQKEKNFPYTNNMLIQDRTFMEQFEIFCKTMLDDGLMSEECFKHIETLFKEKIQEIVTPNIIVFLECRTKKNMERIHIRAREGEADKIQPEYIEKLSQYYQKFKQVLQTCYANICLIVVETDDKTPLQVFEEANRQIELHLQSN